MDIRNLTRILVIVIAAAQATSCGVMGDLFGGGGRGESSEVERIVFVRENQIHTSWLRTAQLETLTDPGTFSSPIWSPNGRKVAFIEIVDGVEILSTVDTNGENKTSHFEGDIGDNLIAWDPDGTHLLFLSGEGGAAGLVTYTAMRVDIETGFSEPLGVLAPTWTHFRWSPVGDRLFYIALSSTSWDISFLGIEPVGVGSIQEDNGRDEIFPTISPDGQAVAYLSQRGGPSELRVHAIPTGEHITVADTRISQRPPVWSWNGDRLAFVKEGQIWSVGSDGDGLTQITNEKANYQLVEWSPGGSELIYRANIETDRVVQVSSEVYLLRLQDRSSEQILDFGDDLDILWKQN